MPDGSFSTFARQLSGDDQDNSAARIDRKIAELEDRLSDGPLTRDDEINIAHSARFVAGLCRQEGLTPKTSSARLARLLQAFA
jgi:hypothetical protein